MEKLKAEFEYCEQSKKTPFPEPKKTSDSSGSGFIKAPKMPYFDEDKDFMDSYLNRFEKFAVSQNADKSTWVLSLSALLRGRALDVYSMMSKDNVNDYDKLKAALLKRYQFTADGFKKRFRSSYPAQGESPVQFITRLENYLVRWVELAGDDKTYDGIKKLFVEEQYLRSCPKEMSVHLREEKPTTLKDLGERAETYLEARSADIVFGIDPTRSFERCENRLSQDNAINAVPLGISDNNVQERLQSLLRRGQVHNSIQLFGQVRPFQYRDKQHMESPDRHHSNVVHSGAITATVQGTLLKIVE